MVLTEGFPPHFDRLSQQPLGVDVQAQAAVDTPQRVQEVTAHLGLALQVLAYPGRTPVQHLPRGDGVPLCLPRIGDLEQAGHEVGHLS